MRRGKMRKKWMERRRILALFALLLGASPAAAYAKLFEMKVIDNVAYYQGDKADPVRHRLDIYLPQGDKDFPVLFFVHGGGWVEGNKNQFGVYGAFAGNFVRQGVAVVCPNYRLSPAVRHP